LANIGTKWRKFIAVGCVHGELACKEAQRAVLQFAERWKPETRIDLGDVMDFAAFRGGAKGTSDESRNVAVDFSAGADWLTRFRPTHRCFGNHDDRIAKLTASPNAIVAHCAGKVLEDLRRIDEQNKTIVRQYEPDQYFEFGDTKFLHGFYFNEQAIRDHAEAYGRVVIAHLHTPGEAWGRRLDHPTGWCVGTLGEVRRFDYAKTRRATLRWGHGLVFGEYSDKHCAVFLARQECNGGAAEDWRLPL
jgi:hypothetical protein